MLQTFSVTNSIRKIKVDDWAAKNTLDQRRSPNKIKKIRILCSYLGPGHLVPALPLPVSCDSHTLVSAGTQ